MEKKKNMIILIIFIFIIQLLLFPTTSEASEFWDAIKQGRKFLSEGKKSTITQKDENGNVVEVVVPFDDEGMKSSLSDIFNTLALIGSAITVIVGGIIGIQFMLASAEDKAKIKESMIPYVIGAFVVFGAFGIWRLVVTVLDTVV